MSGLSLSPSLREMTRPGRVVDPHLVERQEPCACGEDVVQLFCEDAMTAVQRHNGSPAHAAMRAALPQGGCTPTAGPSPVDLSSAPPVRSVPALRAAGGARYYADDAVTIYHGDCRDVLPTLSGDAVITDPPYGVGKEYGSEYEDVGGDPYWAFMRSVVDLCRASAPTVLMTHRVLALRELAGWDWVAAWVKRNQQMRLFSMPVLPTWEPILCWGIKGLDAEHRKDTFTVDAIPSTSIIGGHPFPKPKALMAQLIEWTGASTVIDPFLGSGTTLFAAKDLGRKAIGIEIEERYCEIAARRCSQEVLGLGA